MLACAVALVASASILACGTADPESSRTDLTTTAPPTAAPPTTAPTSAAPTSKPARPAALLAEVCGGAPEITELGTLHDDELTELSGLVAGHRDPSIWWAHNDSGDRARIFALRAGADGEIERVGTVELVDRRGRAVEARDWEDLAIGPPSRPDGPATLHVGDIGDNAGAHPSIRVLRLPEPELDVADRTVEVDTLTLTYPDGPHDAEALLVDPVDGALHVITKDWSLRGASELYRAAGDLPDGSTTELTHVATLPLPAATLVTAADITPDGGLVALRSYGAVTLYERPAGQPLSAAFETVPCDGPVPRERQGETVAFAVDGESYTTISEGEDAVLHRTAAP
ncbi:MAG: hypothetical protein ACYC2O_08205 [Microthrixaceae bacterium]